MKMFDVDVNTIINLDNIDYVRFDKVEDQKAVVAGIGGQSFIIPISKHKEFFTELVALGIKPNNQFVSV